ncbi:MAG: TIGR00341 family protein, partial [Deltaproteobacteria bacterium]|nr:TIGR00341 family protein [Deltaproteobacteria bacterium]
MEPFFRTQISDERAANVINDISVGSEPELRFYTMVAASTAIATFGLISNSTAVVIGAMLVAPLMTPIFGIALALIRGDASLLGRSIRAEIAGVFLTVVLAACFGFLMPELEATQEMLSRTKPNLLDLLVAVFAGFAGAYAMVDEHISPALPGVAIATAIVPPLANSGLCIALGAYYGAVGSFLLFFANFLSILLVASFIFWASGMTREFGSITKKDVFRRFGLATLGFFIVAALLSKGLIDMVQARQLRGSINNVLTEEFSHLPATELRKVVHQKHAGKIYILAHVHASGDITPSGVKLMEEALENELNSPVELFVRSTLSEDVSSTGSINQVLTETLDGFFVGRKPDPRIKLIKLAEQTIREYMDTKPALYVEEINLVPISGKPLILATLFGMRNLSPEEIQNLEFKIRQRTGDDTINLAIRHIDVEVHDRFGKAYYEWATFQGLT